MRTYLIKFHNGEQFCSILKLTGSSIFAVSHFSSTISMTSHWKCMSIWLWSSYVVFQEENVLVHATSPWLFHVRWLHFNELLHWASDLWLSYYWWTLNKSSWSITLLTNSGCLLSFLINQINGFLTTSHFCLAETLITPDVSSLSAMTDFMFSRSPLSVFKSLL